MLFPDVLTYKFKFNKNYFTKHVPNATGPYKTSINV